MPAKALELGGMLLRSNKFKNPINYWSAYLRRQAPKDGACKLRSGKVISLSSNPHDIVTVMVNFCRREYGEIKRGWCVVDIGANIGVFTVVAMESGASQVIAFEPNNEAYEVLRKNVETNELQDKVQIYHRAVSHLSGESVYIPTSSSPYNRVQNSASILENVHEVKTISLADALSDLYRVDLMKLDCEGAEYQIILRSDPAVFEKIKRIRMELHPSKSYSRIEVIVHLESMGYQLVRRSGLIFWFER